MKDSIAEKLREMVVEMINGDIIALDEAVVSLEHPVLDDRGTLNDSGIRRMRLDVTYSKREAK